MNWFYKGSGRLWRSAAWLLCFRLVFSFGFVMLACCASALAQADSIAFSADKNAAYHLMKIPGKHALNQQWKIYAISAGTALTIVYPLKYITNVQRPDKSNNRSFPSAHAAVAFASAEFVRHEYWNTSPWIGVGAYGVATAIAVQRVANNRHSIADVVVGAGIGTLSAVASSWLYDRVFKKTFLSSQKSQ